VGFIFSTPLVLLAQNQPGGGSGWALMLTLWIPLLVVFYFLLMRPQQKERARRQAMINNLKKNDRVLTVGGIYGVVTNVRRELDEVTIKVDEASNTKLRMTLGSISRVLGDEPQSESASK
jgi:preprotein translocase subunit YajC